MCAYPGVGRIKGGARVACFTRRVREGEMKVTEVLRVTIVDLTPLTRNERTIDAHSISIFSFKVWFAFKPSPSSIPVNKLHLLCEGLRGLVESISEQAAS